MYHAGYTAWDLFVSIVEEGRGGPSADQRRRGGEPEVHHHGRASVLAPPQSSSVRVHRGAQLRNHVWRTTEVDTADHGGRHHVVLSLVLHRTGVETGVTTTGEPCIEY